METVNLDLIRFVLDGALGVGCLVLMVRLRRQRPSHSRSGARAGRHSPQIGADKPSGAQVSTSQEQPQAPGTPAGALKEEVLSLTRAGLAAVEIARRTGLARGEVELIQKFSAPARRPPPP